MNHLTRAQEFLYPVTSGSESYRAFVKEHDLVGRILLIPIVIADGLLEVAKGIATLATRLFQSLGNILGAPFYEDCSIKGAIDRLKETVYATVDIYFVPFRCAWNVVKVLDNPRNSSSIAEDIDE